MKRLILVLAGILSAAVVLNAETPADKAATENVLNITPEQPHTHWFANAGFAATVMNQIGFNVRAGKYGKHGMYVGLTGAQLHKTMYNGKEYTNYANISAGYIYNIPSSLKTGKDESNWLQLMVGLGVERRLREVTYTSGTSSNIYKVRIHPAMELGLMERIGKINLYQTLQVDSQLFMCANLGVGITFGK